MMSSLPVGVSRTLPALTTNVAIAEIEHWQDGFGGKDLAGPV
jgi:hypothetical protein